MAGEVTEPVSASQLSAVNIDRRHYGLVSASVPVHASFSSITMDDHRVYRQDLLRTMTLHTPSGRVGDGAIAP